MAIIDFAPTIQQLTRFNVGGISSGEAFVDLDVTHPWMRLTGVPIYMNYAAIPATPDNHWNFASSPDKPGLGDVFEFKFSHCGVFTISNQGSVVASQWIIQFLDESNNIIGGLRQGTTSLASPPWSRGYQLCAGSNVAGIAGADIYPLSAYVGCLFTVEVDAAEIVVNFYNNTLSDVIAGLPMTLIATVTAPNTVTNFGPVSQVRMQPNAGSSTTGTGGGRYLGYNAAMIEPSFTVNENMANVVMTNALGLTTAGAGLSDLPLLSAITNTPRQTGVMASLFTGHSRNLRRTFKLTPAAADPKMTGWSLVSTRLTVNYGLTKAAQLNLGTDSELELFLRHSGTNYSLGEFGTNFGTETFQFDINPGTGIPYENLNAIEFGIVIREK